MIMAELRLIRIGTVSRRIEIENRRYNMCIVGMHIMLAIAGGLMRAIIRNHRPGNLDRQQAQHEQDKKATHDEHYSGDKLALSIFITT